MTNPGFPDYQSSANQEAGFIADTIANIGPGGSFIIFEGASPTYKHIMLQINCASGFVRLVVNYTELTVGNATYFVNDFIIPPYQVVILIPVISSGMVITFDHPSNPAGTTVAYGMTGTNAFDGGYRFLPGELTAVFGPVSVPANTLESFDIQGVGTGPMQINMNSSVLGANVGWLLGMYNLDGTKGAQIAEKLLTSNDSNDVVYLPPRPCFVTVFNETAGAATIAWTGTLAGGMY